MCLDVGVGTENGSPCIQVNRPGKGQLSVWDERFGDQNLWGRSTNCLDLPACFINMDLDLVKKSDWSN